jgi:hypothetical protein
MQAAVVSSGEVDLFMLWNEAIGLATRQEQSHGLIEPRYPKRNSRSNLDHFAEKLAGWLKAESSRGRKQRLSVKELYVRLRQLGYCGSYDRVCAFARRWRRAQQEAARTVGRGCSFLCSSGVRAWRCVPV